MKTVDRLIIFLGPFSPIGPLVSGVICALIMGAIGTVIGALSYICLDWSALSSFATASVFFCFSLHYIVNRATKLYNDSVGSYPS